MWTSVPITPTTVMTKPFAQTRLAHTIAHAQKVFWASTEIVQVADFLLLNTHK